MSARKIRTTTDLGNVIVDGWLDGRQGTYLRFEYRLDGFYVPGSADCISGHKLYRLAKAIVRQFEGDKK